MDKFVKLFNGRRKELGYKTMSSFADYSGISSGMLSKYLNSISIPEYKTLKILSRALEIDYIEMFSAVGVYENSYIKEQQEIDNETYQSLIDICKSIFDKNISLRTAFLELLAERFDKFQCAGFINRLSEHESWIEHLDNHYDSSYDKTNVYNARANRICIRIFTGMVAHDYTWIRGFQNDLKKILEQSIPEEINLPQKVDITKMKYRFILTLDGKEFTNKEIERIINVTRFERGF